MSVGNRRYSDVSLTLEVTLGSLLDSLLDLVVGGTLLNADGQVNDGDVGSRDTHRHASELAVKIGDDLANGLGGTSAAGDDVLGSGAATTPVLGGWAVNDLLGGSVGVDGSHQTLNDGEFVVDDLGKRCQAVGGARRVGEHVDVGLVGLVVDAHDEHRSIGGGSRDDNLLGTALQMGTSLVLCGEDTSGLDDVVGTGLAPGDLSGVLLCVELDGLAVDLQVVAVDLDGALELAVGAVIAEHVGLWQGQRSNTDRHGEGIAHGIVRLNEGVVDGDNVNVVVLNAGRWCQSRLANRQAWRGWGDAHALRKTILPMRPKPLIPTLTTIVV